MNRRCWLSRSFMTAASLSLPVASGAAEFPLSKRVRKAIKFANIDAPELSLEDRFRLAADCGFDGVELRHVHADQEAEFIRAAERTGVPIHGVVNSSEPDLARALRFCAAVGGDSILIVARYDRKRPLMESWNESLERVRKALPVAEETGVRILVENVWAGFLISALDAERFIAEVDHPMFGLYFDVGNNVRWGVPEHWIGLLGPYIHKLDIKEWDERRHQKEGLRAGFGSELGDGTIDWRAVREALIGIDYQGWATAEVGDADAVRLADIAERMDRVLALSQDA